jgi:hypothetical protein
VHTDPTRPSFLSYHWDANVIQGGVRCEAIARGYAPSQVQIEEAKIGSIIRGIDSYFTAACLQMERITDNPTSSERGDRFNVSHAAMGDEHRVMEQQVADLHFYLICWAQVRRHMQKAKDQKLLASAGEVYRRHASTLAHYADLRDHFEHIDERLPGERHDTHWRDNPRPNGLAPGVTYWGWGSDSSGNLVIGNRSWDVSSKSLETLEHIVTEWHLELRQEAIDTFVSVRCTLAMQAWNERGEEPATSTES